MPSRHKTALLGWHPPAELAAWARAEADRRGGKGALSGLLTEALAAYRATVALDQEIHHDHQDSGRQQPVRQA